MVFDTKAWFWAELGDANNTEVGALIDAAKDEASGVSASSKCHADARAWSCHQRMPSLTPRALHSVQLQDLFWDQT